ncbi:MAG: hypothetical protein A2086_07970 [Spirochaetes bacterium GWD1_27_9]|nr:MAG: hypothetical protein A2Z98_04910 [Spirochaetes bacterium GWB1_27_13]OHD23899.1 MAG: hypothetical protein A2Y34_18690 [Spirochaetes bacterium GWC1_27_15]OHD34458.1 MAG: hypothetical protein A2086_07970 [Spirochaetes bacterium GWD1_27_9]
MNFFSKRSFLMVLFTSFAFTMMFSAKLDVGTDKVAKINNRVIILKELEREFEQRSKLPSMDGSPVTKKSVLESMIDEELLRNEVKKQSIVLDENQVNELLEQYKQMYIQEMTKQNPSFKFTDEEYKAYIQKEVKIPYDKFVERIQETIMVRQFIMKRAEKKLKDASEKVFSDNDLENFYDSNINEFVMPKSVEVKHIFLKTVLGDGKTLLPESEKAIVKKRIDDILARLQKGESFDTLCELNSEDVESRDRKDAKGNFTRGYLGPVAKVSPFREVFGDTLLTALFGLTKNTYSPVLESKLGYHIFYIIDKKDQYIVPFKDAKERISAYFRMNEQQKVLSDEFLIVVKELKTKANIEYYIDINKL